MTRLEKLCLEEIKRRQLPEDEDYFEGFVERVAIVAESNDWTDEKAVKFVAGYKDKRICQPSLME